MDQDTRRRQQTDQIFAVSIRLKLFYLKISEYFSGAADIQTYFGPFLAGVGGPRAPSGEYSRIESPDLSFLTVSKLLPEQAHFIPQFVYFSHVINSLVGVCNDRIFQVATDLSRSTYVDVE